MRRESIKTVSYTHLDVYKRQVVGDAILAQYPDVDAIYVTWDSPAEQIIESAVAVGRDDLIVTTVDLGDSSARIMAENGMIKAIGSPRSYEDGNAIAMSALYALIDKDLGSGYIATPTMGVTSENLLDAYKTIFNTCLLYTSTISPFRRTDIVSEISRISFILCDI